MIDKGREFHKVMHDGRNDRRLSSKRHKGISIVLFRRVWLARVDTQAGTGQWWRTLALSQLPEQEMLVPTAPPGERWSADSRQHKIIHAIMKERVMELTRKNQAEMRIGLKARTNARSLPLISLREQ